MNTNWNRVYILAIVIIALVVEIVGLFITTFNAHNTLLLIGGGSIALISVPIVVILLTKLIDEFNK